VTSHLTVVTIEILPFERRSKLHTSPLAPAAKPAMRPSHHVTATARAQCLRASLVPFFLPKFQMATENPDVFGFVRLSLGDQFGRGFQLVADLPEAVQINLHL
jgi:hypothetical protein